MKRILKLTAVVSALVLCFGIGAMVSPVQAAATECFAESCDYGQIYHEVCCLEFVPDNPKCRSKKCPGEIMLVCTQELCDEVWLDEEPVSPTPEESTVACP